MSYLQQLFVQLVRLADLIDCSKDYTTIPILNSQQLTWDPMSKPVLFYPLILLIDLSFDFSKIIHRVVDRRSRQYY